MSYTVAFPDTDYSTIRCASDTWVRDYLTVQNSPVLFGCRTGLCGTCVVRVSGPVLPADRAEQEILAAYAANPEARLACQLQPQGDIALWRS
ncbi:MAG: 2Fe-2S iron-sulfur cluster-binding protein [Elainella sp.]